LWLRFAKSTRSTGGRPISDVHVQTYIKHGAKRYRQFNIFDDMTTLVHEQMATMQNELIQATEARENQLISKLLKALTSYDSPYATHAQLQTIMASIDVNAKKWHPIPNLQNHQIKNEANNDDMEIDIPNGDEKPPDDPQSPPKRQ
jgi:hypothetical protein